MKNNLHTTSSSPEEIQQILKARAAVLAKEAVAKKEIKHPLSVLQFKLADETYAIASSFIREVYAAKGIKPLPCTPDFVCGIINVRSQVMSVIDLKPLLGLKKQESIGYPIIIILHSDSMEFGIGADQILGANIIDLKAMQTKLPSVKGRGETYLKGIINQHIVVLDGYKLLTDPNLIVDETVE